MYWQNGSVYPINIFDNILVTGGYFNRFVLQEPKRKNVIYRRTVGSILNS